jgi:SAM-dependent methyltransferase
VSTSLIYRSALGYELLMRVLYGRHYATRMRSVAEEVPPGSSVLELCCGPGTLYTRYLRGRVSGYVGLDVNAHFVDRLRRQGIDARVLDLTRDRAPLPEADVVLMQASLYHFLPEAHEVVDRMLAAASRRVIVSEPVRNLASSTNPLIGRLGRRAANPGVGGGERRFTEATLDELFRRYREQVREARLIPGGREKLYVLTGRRAASDGAGGS